MLRHLLVIAGPTASGKTAVAVELAKLINGEIISADSMQVYQHLSIGTAKPSKVEVQSIPYHLIDHVPPDEQYHLGRFVEEAEHCISEITARDRVPIVCGGTGLYIRGLLYGIFEGGRPHHETRKVLTKRLESDGLPALYQELKKVDEQSARLYGPNDTQRIVRALEVYHSTGRPLSSYHNQGPEPKTPYKLYVLTCPRPTLYDRIERRVDAMMEQGLLEEVRQYLAAGHSRNNPAINALGYRELIDVIEQDADLGHALDEMKKKSRNYAKRQETWFRSMPGAQWIQIENRTPTETAELIARDMEKFVEC